MPKLNTIYTSSGPILTTKQRPARRAAAAAHGRQTQEAAPDRQQAPALEGIQPQTLPRDGYSRFKQLQPFLPVSREKWRQLTRDGRAPAPVRLGARCTVWKNSDVHQWLADPLNYKAAD
ncbi:helix-turn-helix transcriptional regulator [Cupriavidus necator]|uniref:helix-turn-helix transcriptional regulator n=1 Tax=Cupriavidus necator TaxID=106590 RepID=UPI003F73BD10